MPHRLIDYPFATSCRLSIFVIPYDVGEGFTVQVSYRVNLGQWSSSALYIYIESMYAFPSVNPWVWWLYCPGRRAPERGSVVHSQRNVEVGFIAVKPMCRYWHGR